MRHTISVLVENKFGVLARIAGLFSGRGFNIETLNVGPNLDPKFSRINAVIVGDNNALDQCIKQLSKLINVIEIEDFSHGIPFVARELILLKIKVDKSQRAELIQICELFRAKIIDVSPHSMIVEITGNDSKIKAFLGLVEPFNILQMSRTGKVALSRRTASESD